MIREATLFAGLVPRHGLAASLLTDEGVRSFSLGYDWQEDR
jgi:hypothetical protein